MISGTSVAAALALFFGALGTALGATPRPIPLTVALPGGLSPRTVGYYLAQEKGYFDAAGLTVHFVTPAEGHVPSDALNVSSTGGKADLAVDAMPVALRSREHGAKIVHVAQIFRFAGMELVCRPAVDQPEALKDRAVSVVFGGLESAFYAWMTTLDLNAFGGPGGVTVLRQNNALEAFQRYQVDCATTFTYQAPLDFAAAGLAPQGLRLYRYQDLGQATLEDGIYARESDLHDPDRVAAFAAFLTATRKGWQLLHDNTKAGVDLLHADPAFAKADPAMLKQALDAVDDLVAPNKGPIGKLDPDSYDRTVNLLLTAAPDPVLTRAPVQATSSAIWQKQK
jgi:NitT/TauT family transport system substrate-binding protein